MTAPAARFPAAALKDLVTLPGVGRKTANVVVLGNAFDVPGITVDTHFGRLARRFGWTSQDDPEKVEQEVGALFPKSEWTMLSHRLIWHGRRVCHSRRPACGACGIARLCPSFGEGPTDEAVARRLVKPGPVLLTPGSPMSAGSRSSAGNVPAVPGWLARLAAAAEHAQVPAALRRPPRIREPATRPVLLVLFRRQRRRPTPTCCSSAAARTCASTRGSPRSPAAPSTRLTAARSGAALREGAEETGIDPAGMCRCWRCCRICTSGGPTSG